MDGIVYPTSEHAYQAYKTSSITIRKRIAALKTPGQAKRYGQKISPLPSKWDYTKFSTMRMILEIKFSDPVLEAQLLATGDDELIETNFWGDTIWGVCNGVGANNLGNMLMNIRWHKQHPPAQPTSVF